MTALSTIPVLRSGDLVLSRDFYERLGFVCESVGAAYLIVRREGIELHLSPPDDPSRPTECGAYIRGGAIDALYEEWASTGLVSDRYRRPWGMVEFYLSDPGGALLRFGRPSRPNDPADDALPAHPLDR